MSPYSTVIDGDVRDKITVFLTPTNIAIAAPALLLLYLLLNAFYNVYFHPLAKFPGPFWAKVTRLWITWQCYKSREPYVLMELAKKYGMWNFLDRPSENPVCFCLLLSWQLQGPVVRITPALLHVSDATKLPVIYNRTGDKSKHYITGSFGATESLFHMQTNSQHSRYRKAIAGPVCLFSLLQLCTAI